MHTHNHGGAGEEPEKVDATKGFEQSDVRVRGVVVFLVALGVFVGVAGALAYGIGKALNAHMAKEDGPTSRWSKTVDVRPLGDMPNNPEMQNKLAKLNEEMPEPRLQSDDGLQDVADLHAREDLLLDHYTWAAEGANGEKKVRIPIERAMELLAQRGLPVAQATAKRPLLTGEKDPTELSAPLTTGFVRTGYEQAEEKKQGRGTRD